MAFDGLQDYLSALAIPHRTGVGRTGVARRALEDAPASWMGRGVGIALLIGCPLAAHTLAVMQAVTEWRRDGLPACYTIDAGPNVHVICPVEAADQIAEWLRQIPGVVQVLTAHPGGPARLEFC